MKKLALILMAAAVCVACNKIAEKQQTTPAEEVVVVEEAVAEVPEAVEEEIAPEDIPQRVQMPEFPGGMDELMKYLSDNIQYPSKAKDLEEVAIEVEHTRCLMDQIDGECGRSKPIHHLALEVHLFEHKQQRH